MLSRPTAWRVPPLLVAALFLLPAIVLWVDPSCARGVSWVFAAAGANQLLAGVREFVERRAKRGAISPDQQHEAWLLVAVLHNGAPKIAACAGDAARGLVGLEGNWYGLGMRGLDVDGRWPRGLWVWEGRVLPPFMLDQEVMPDAGPEWLGSWRRATPEEAQRYAAGEPVWGSADA